MHNNNYYYYHTLTLEAIRYHLTVNIEWIRPINELNYYKLKGKLTSTVSPTLTHVFIVTFLKEAYQDGSEHTVTAAVCED